MVIPVEAVLCWFEANSLARYDEKPGLPTILNEESYEEKQMSDQKTYSVPAEVSARAHIDEAKYQEMYQRSVSDPDAFWAEQAKELVTWFEPWKKVSEWDYDNADIKWFQGAKLNVSFNCLDRHLDTRGDQVAILWEGDDPAVDKKITYRELHAEVCRFANAMKARGVKKGDRVSIYMPMIPEVIVAMLACTRIGAVHSVVFGGFSPEALKDRILDSDCQVVITSDEGVRGGRPIPLKANTDKALESCPNVHTVFVVKRTGGEIAWKDGRDVWYEEAMASADAVCEPEAMDAEDPLFILYTSGSTGKPKGVLHTTGGYLLYAAITHKYVFDYHDGDIYWCTADVGWVTGHTYIVYGPLANGAVSLAFEGIPTYPDASRFWQVVDKHDVNIFYTAPTALRALMSQGDEPVKKASRKTLRLLGTVGEPINPEAWEWYYHVVGDERCPIVDTWWQTETGGILITPLPGATALKPGSATRPFFGVVPELVDAEGNVLEGENQGGLCIRQPWPGQMRTVYGDHQRFIDTYFRTYMGKYFSGDGARRDKDGYYWITGRVDDVINVSGHRMGTAEVESALVLHKDVAEAAVVGFPHDIKGQGIYAYVTPMVGVEPSEELRKELIALVRDEIGAIAAPDVIQWAPGLPKTRSGKIMRRILRKVAANELDSLGDTSTLADPSVVNELIEHRATK
uniref:Acetyl-coenzyme A synthetase n=1 Tax=Candidatus Kentrum sp. FW TaxID=2126338 RepID=A0A450U156_9GAMM|nr:MAG: acetyl-coenzyme A synthetase [Candidatus Kentron sp. FW]